MSKLTIVGDLHIQHSNLEKHIELFKTIEDLNNPVVLLGDIFHTKEIVRSKCLNFLIDRLKESKLKFYILVGNHDQHNLHTLDHSLEPLKLLPNVEVMDSLYFFKDANLAAIPYIHEVSQFRKELEKAKQKNVKAIFLHQGINGFDYGNGIIEHNSVDLTEFSTTPLVISGHFHKFQKKNNLIYLGTPFTHDFSEANQNKYIAELDLNSLSITLIPTNFEQHRVFYIRNKATLADIVNILDSKHPTKVKIEVSKEDFVTWDLDKLKEFPNVAINTTFIKSTVVEPKQEHTSHEDFLYWFLTEIKKLDSKLAIKALNLFKGEEG